MSRILTPTRWLWCVVVVSLVATVSPLLLSYGSVSWTVLARVGEAVIVALLLVSVLRMPVGRRSAWWFLAAYASLTLLADVVYDIENLSAGPDPSFVPSDALYFSAYAAALGAAVLLLRVVADRGRDAAAWIDTGIIAVAIIALTTVVIIGPVLGGDVTDPTVPIDTLLYPALDVLVLVCLMRVLNGSPAVRTPLALVTLSFGIYLIADALYARAELHGSLDRFTGPLEVLYLGALAVLSMAAANPQAGDMSRPGEAGSERPDRRRIITLTVGVMASPILALIIAWPDRHFLEQFLAALTILTILLALWRIRQLLAAVDRQSQLLDRQARTDALTGLPNRRTLDFELDRAVGAATATGDPLTLAMLDLDHFKAYNDTYGHVAGDELLASCARQWTRILVPGAFLARYGGEEFALLLPRMPGPEALGLLEALRASTPQGQTVSIGVAAHRHGESGTQLLHRADLALYAAKAAGRNRVVAAETVT